MQETDQSLQTLQDIKRMMERSSRFISLSGWSGISAGTCALIAAWVTSKRIDCWRIGDCLFPQLSGGGAADLKRDLFIIGGITFIAASVTAFIFTFVRSKKNGTPIWNLMVRRLMWSVMIPLLAGGCLLYRMIQLEQFELVAPGCLIIYGLALLNGSKYTLGEIRYLAIGQLILGIINLWMIGYGLHFWALGFGVLHIMYGIWMWFKYER
ncbi:MAG: hypothetical protein H7Y31_16550 [Chitinophagaceae bacterium]|nr:hypothetical protein [Chitinophagaceae bacterium]